MRDAHTSVIVSHYRGDTQEISYLRKAFLMNDCQISYKKISQTRLHTWMVAAAQCDKDWRHNKDVFLWNIWGQRSSDRLLILHIPQFSFPKENIFLTIQICSDQRPLSGTVTSRQRSVHGNKGRREMKHWYKPLFVYTSFKCLQMSCTHIWPTNVSAIICWFFFALIRATFLNQDNEWMNEVLCSSQHYLFAH